MYKNFIIALAGLSALSSYAQNFEKRACEEDLVSTGDKPATIIFKNETKLDLAYYWIDFEGNSQFFGNISPLSSIEQETSIGQYWLVADLNKNCFGKFAALKSGRVTIPIQKSTGGSGFLTYNTAAQPSEQLKYSSSAPQIIGLFQDNHVFMAWKDNESEKIKVSAYAKNGNAFTLAWLKEVPAGLDMLGGLTGDGDNLYCMTAIKEDLSQNQTILGYRPNVLNLSKIDKEGNAVWNKNLNAKKYVRNPIFSPTLAGTADLTFGNRKIVLAYAGNTLPDENRLRHQGASFVVVDAETGEATTEGYGETSWRHSFDQRILFDGKDFVVLDLGDAGWYMPAGGIAVRKIIIDEPAQKIPDQNKEGIYVYARHSETTGSQNATFISMGDIVEGEAGYGVLFSSEKTNRNQARNGWNEPILEPRNLGFVHVVKDFDQVNDGKNGNQLQTGNTWFNAQYRITKINITENIVDTPSSNPKAQPGGQTIARPDKPNLTFTTASVAWLTNFQAGQTFTSVERPKLIKIGNQQYIAVWEEWLVTTRTSQKPVLTYQSTKVMLLDEYGNVLKPSRSIQARLNPNGADKLFLLEGKAAWIVGENNQFKLNTLDANLKLEVSNLNF
ncbi:MAG: hypothetical protein H7Y04_08070 [Verrucomicrobia bacterium]|nr:hypothetical protein [Cytophagales bacterium]